MVAPGRGYLHWSKHALAIACDQANTPGLQATLVLINVIDKPQRSD